MSEKNIINKEVMREFLHHLSNNFTIVGPVDTGKVIEYRIAGASEILMDDMVSYKSAKEWFFPQTELMFTFNNDEVIDNVEVPGYVIFGVKPCDLEALRVMDEVYSSGKYTDAFFKRRFEANFLIGVGCIEKKPGCFCQEMCVDKKFSDFCDIMLTDCGDSYFVEYLSEKGREALMNCIITKDVDVDNKLTKQGDNLSVLSNEASEVNETGVKNEASKLNEASVKNEVRKLNKAQIYVGEFQSDKLMLDIGVDDTVYFDIIDWAKVTETCKGCGICTYLCPTCYCFDFKDVSEKGEAKRYKCWDSCMYPKFTLHASGHNPRENRYERYRQRVLHKYKYVPENFDGFVACTGCGRCVRSCPVGVNIREIVKQIKSVKCRV